MQDFQYDVVAIGGGASGFFAGIQAASQGKSVAIFEKTQKLLSKVKVSGGGRCNVTHDCEYPSQLVNHYPRGGKSLRKAFELFGVKQTRNWFESRGVRLKVEDDGRIFPISNDSQSIIDCLMKEARKNKISIHLGSEIVSLQKMESSFEMELKKGEKIRCDKVILTCGGFNKKEAYHWISNLDIQIIDPIPSLFTFNVPDSDLKELKGLSVKLGSVQVPGSKWKMEGPLLITHWGFSAPAIIKLSSWAAIDFFDRNYQFPILLNWTGLDEKDVKENLEAYRAGHPKKQVATNQLFDIPLRLWQRLCEKAEISQVQQYHDLSKKQFNKLIEMIIRCPYNVNGKTTFKEEFVTCGGVELSEVDLKTFESKKIPGLYFAGEVLNIDGVTGGFNFQHAWTSGYLAGNNAKE